MSYNPRRTRSKQSAKAPRWVTLRASMTFATPHKIWRVATWQQEDRRRGKRGGGKGGKESPRAPLSKSSAECVSNHSQHH